MDWNVPKQRAAFLDLHSDNPREGPGDFISTAQAFAVAALAINPSDAPIDPPSDPPSDKGFELRGKYADDPDGALVIKEGQMEIDAWRNHGEHFSYAFFVVQPEVA